MIVAVALGLRLPPRGWAPAGWDPAARASRVRQSDRALSPLQMLGTPHFWLQALEEILFRHTHLEPSQALA